MAFFKDRAIKKILDFIRPEHRAEAYKAIQGVFLSNSPEDIQEYIDYDYSNLNTVLDLFYSNGFLIYSDVDIKSFKEDVRGIIEEIYHIEYEATKNGNSNKTR